MHYSDLCTITPNFSISKETIIVITVVNQSANYFYQDIQTFYGSVIFSINLYVHNNNNNNKIIIITKTMFMM